MLAKCVEDSLFAKLTKNMVNIVRQRSILLVLKNHNEMESLVKWKQNAMESLVIEKEEFKSEKGVFERGVSKRERERERLQWVILLVNLDWALLRNLKW